MTLAVTISFTLVTVPSTYNLLGVYTKYLVFTFFCTTHAYASYLCIQLLFKKNINKFLQIAKKVLFIFLPFFAINYVSLFYFHKALFFSDKEFANVGMYLAHNWGINYFWFDWFGYEYHMYLLTLSIITIFVYHFNLPRILIENSVKRIH